jgi:DNA replication protein DnaC
MYNQMTQDKLNMLKLYGMAQGFQDQLESPGYNELSFEERLGMLVDKEVNYRENRRLKSLLKKARLRYSQACIEDIDFNATRGFSREQIMNLSVNSWIQKNQNIIMTGATGTGKSYLACAFGNNACRAGISAYYARLPLLLKELSIANNDGSYGKLLVKYSKIKLLIIDDYGFDPLKDKERRSYLDIIEDRYNCSSTIICSQLPIESWHDNIGDPTVADAICDRLIHNAHKIKLKGESMRKKHSTLEVKSHG